jgi:hypothetical protein
MNKKVIRCFLFALCCVRYASCDYDEQDNAKNPDVAIAREYHTINSKKHDTSEAPAKICSWKTRAYMSALVITFLVYRAAETSGNE